MGYLLSRRGIVDTPLKDATTMFMSGYLDTLVTDGVVDELPMFCRESMQTLLNDMVSIQILDEWHHRGIQCGCNHMYLKEKG
jgi:hypothetical protein